MKARLLRTCALLTLLLTLLLSLGASPAAAQEVPELKINSKHYIVIDADTGEIFAQRGARDQVAMASLTKVFTAIEAIEAAGPGLEITTTEDDLVSADNSMMGFGVGETFPLEDLLYGLMLPSGNDAANAIARALGGEPGDSGEAARQRFVDQMNTRIANMGLTDTHLVNPSGWGVPGHHSSAHDLAVFTMYALHYPRFVQLISTLDYTTGDYTMRNNNRLLTMYPSLLGGKTGFDYDAGWCLIEVARRDGNTMISVTLDGIHDDSDWYDDNQVLLEYAFDQKAQRLAAGGAIAGQIVSYRDPDAAVIAQMATSGSSLAFGPMAVPNAGISAESAPLETAPITGDAADLAASGEPASLGELTVAGGPATSGWQLLATGLVAAGVLGGSLVFTFLQPVTARGSRRSRPGGRRLMLPSLPHHLSRKHPERDATV